MFCWCKLGTWANTVCFSSSFRIFLLERVHVLISLVCAFCLRFKPWYGWSAQGKLPNKFVQICTVLDFHDYKNKKRTYLMHISWMEVVNACTFSEMSCFGNKCKMLVLLLTFVVSPQSQTGSHPKVFKNIAWWTAC